MEISQIMNQKTKLRINCDVDPYFDNIPFDHGFRWSNPISFTSVQWLEKVGQTCRLSGFALGSDYCLGFPPRSADQSTNSITSIGAIFLQSKRYDFWTNQPSQATIFFPLYKSVTSVMMLTPLNCSRWFDFFLCIPYFIGALRHTPEYFLYRTATWIILRESNPHQFWGRWARTVLVRKAEKETWQCSDETLIHILIFKPYAIF